MEKEKNACLSGAGKYYRNVIALIGEMYDKIVKAGKKLPYTKDSLYRGYDEFIAAALVKLCLSYGSIGKRQTEFIDDLLAYGKLVDGTDASVFADSSKEMKEKLEKIADEKLSVKPVCLKIAEALDRGKDFGLSKNIFENSVKICFNMKMTDDAFDIKNNGDIARILKALRV